jgi:hypothetical protein
MKCPFNCTLNCPHVMTDNMTKDISCLDCNESKLGTMYTVTILSHDAAREYYRIDLHTKDFGKYPFVVFKSTHPEIYNQLVERDSATKAYPHECNITLVGVVISIDIK